MPTESTAAAAAATTGTAAAPKTRRHLAEITQTFVRTPKVARVLHAQLQKRCSFCCTQVRFWFPPIEFSVFRFLFSFFFLSLSRLLSVCFSPRCYLFERTPMIELRSIEELFHFELRILCTPCSGNRLIEFHGFHEVKITIISD